VKKVGPYMVPRTMSSTNTACLATPFKIKGVNYSYKVKPYYLTVTQKNQLNF